MTLPFLQDNPALTRELRTRLRGARAFGLLFAYLAVLAVTLFLTYFSWWESQRNNPGAAFQVGRVFFSTLFLMQALLVAVITPSLTAGGLTIEREQRTLEMLQVSLLSRFSIVWGKLLAAVGFVGLLVVASLPLFSLGFLLGGVAPDEIIVSCGLLLTIAFLYGAVGLGCSAISKTTTSATLATYAVLTVMFFATLPFAVGGLMAAFTPFGTRGGMGLAALNPMGAMSAAGANDTYFGLTLPAWLTGSGLNILLGVICTLAAGHRIEYPRSDRSGLLRLLVAAYIGLLSLGVYHFTFISLRAMGGGPGDGANFAAVASVLALPVLIPIFATSDFPPQSGGVWTLFNPARLRRGEAPSGLMYVLLLILLAMLAFYLTAHFDAPQAKVSLAQIARLTGLLLATAWGFGGFALFISVATRNRNTAIVLTAAMMVTLYLVPSSVAAWSAGGVPTNTLPFLIGCLSPLFAAGVLFDATHRVPPMDTVTTLLYGGAGVLFLLLAARSYNSANKKFRDS